MSVTLAYQILDIIGSGQDSQKRYYKIKEGVNLGYIYAGDKETYADWAVLANHSDLDEILIAGGGDKIKISVQDGLKLRGSTDLSSTFLITIPKNTEVEVEQVRTMNTSNEIYYQLSYNNIQGWAYGGRLLPESTLDNWVSLVKTVVMTPPNPVNKPASQGGGGAISFNHILLFLSLLLARHKAHIRTIKVR